MVENSKYKTFFDIGLDDQDDRPFAQMICHIDTDKKKKRVVNNELVKKYFVEGNLTKAEMIKLKKILDGSIYEERKQLYEHCKLCSDDFERYDLKNFSKNLKYWNICQPTFPYFPGGLMIYLKDRKISKLENLQDIPEKYFEELINLSITLFDCIKNSIIGDRVSGVNILFNQLSKSELCIHGHIEPIIHNIDELDLGCKYIENRPFDRFTKVINDSIEDEPYLMKIKEGIKIDVESTTIDNAQKTLGKFENKVAYYFERGEKLRNKELLPDDESDIILLNNMAPAAVNFVYLTYYRDRFILSSVPELALDFVPIKEVTNDSGDLYCLSINRFYTNEDNIFMRHFSPLVRPSIKTCTESNTVSKVRVLQKDISRRIEEL